MTLTENFISSYTGIKTPIIVAPMAGPSGGALAAQITIGGGFGFMAAGTFEATSVVIETILSIYSERISGHRFNQT